jgi:hypothetical protein
VVGRPRSESELVAHARRGDLDAFEQLVREHQGMAFRTAEATWGFAAVPERNAMRADDGTWLEMPPEVSALVTKVAGDMRAFPASELIGAAPAPEPRPAAADTGSPPWPEGALIALALAVAGVVVVRAARASGRFRAASS